MKICMILDKGFPPDPRVENEAVALIQAGHEVSLFALNFNNSVARETINGIKVQRYRLSKWFFDKFSPLAFTVPFYLYALKRRINRFLTSEKFEAIHVHDMVVAGVVQQLNRQYKLPLILDLHENRPEIMRSYSHVSSFPGRILINLKKWIKKQNSFASAADRVIVVTEEAKQDLRISAGVASDKIYTVPNFVTLKIFDKYPLSETVLEKHKNNYVILYLGATGLRRGLDTAIISVEKLKDEIPNIKLVIVGKSRDDNYLKKLVVDKNIQKYVNFEGWQDVRYFPSYIKASAICISPLIKNRHHDTTYANKIFQYMAMGKPLIVSNCTAQANIVNQTSCGLVHEPSNSDELAQSIRLLYKNPKMAKQMGEAGRRAVEKKFNWEEAKKHLNVIYSSF